MEWFVRAARAVVPGLDPAVVRDLHVLKGIILEEFAHRRACFEICAPPVRMNGVADSGPAAERTGAGSTVPENGLRQGPTGRRTRCGSRD